jgi:hypothetical protein
MTGDNFAKEAAAVSQRWAASLREMGFLHAAVELDHAADRLDPIEATLDACTKSAGDCTEQTHVA